MSNPPSARISGSEMNRPVPKFEWDRGLRGLLLFAWVVAPTPTLGMTLNQMRSLPGATAIGSRVDEVLKVYGLPAAILDSDVHRNRAVAVEWQGTKMQLGPGTWDLVYGTSRAPQKELTPGWRNPKPAMPAILSGVSSLELVAMGNVGVVTIDRAAHKTRYAVPADQLVAHKIIKVHAQFTAPPPTRKIKAMYGDQCESVTNGPERRALRCWVLVEKDVMPIALYAVDFQIAKSGGRILGYTISGDDVNYVQQKFSGFYQRWLDMVND